MIQKIRNRRWKLEIRNWQLVFLFSIFYFLFSASCFSQPSTDEQLALQYLQNKEYDKAIIYYEKLFDRKNGIAYYNPYLLCLLKLEQHEKAEKMIKKLIKQYPKNLTYIVDLGTLYYDMEKKEKATAEYERAIKQLSAEQKQIFDLANSFIQLQQWDFVIATYQRGRKLLGGFYPFNIEIAEAYAKKGDIAAMVSEYLDLLEKNPEQLQTVQNGLQPSFNEEQDEIKNEIIKTSLLKRIQSRPDKTVFAELLIWFFIQEKNFNGAFVQAKALDKRLGETGERLMALGQICVSNEEYETASKCFQAVIEKGKDNYHYVNARMELLGAMYKKITSKLNFTADDLQQLEKNFLITLEELGKSSGTALLIKNLAHLQAFFLNKTKEAAVLLNEVILFPGINAPVQAECKLELADILLMTGEIWEASLLYSQVELDFKHEPFGNEAKFRNAKLSYYKGEFRWAQTQLDVLKAATEKLIANDAMELSLLISDNLQQENDSIALCMFSKADLLFFSNQIESVLLLLDSIMRKFPATSLADDILYKKYQIHLKQNKYAEAAAELQKIIDQYGWDILGDDALFKLAELNDPEYSGLNNPTKAKQLYEEFLTKYPGSIYTVEARKRFRRLRGDKVN